MDDLISIHAVLGLYCSSSFAKKWFLLSKEEECEAPQKPAGSTFSSLKGAVAERPKGAFCEQLSAMRNQHTSNLITYTRKILNLSFPP
jgi:hypothetical protein